MTVSKYKAMLREVVAEAQHFNDEMGYCFGCAHDWSDGMFRSFRPLKEHGEKCVLVDFGDGQKEWHDNDCFWARAAELLELAP
jgi:hypothetical protein